jgi:DNA polymerase-3 subunit epsilon
MPGVSFTAIDFETTGSVQGYPVEPWQIGVVTVSAEGEHTCWESLLRVGDRPFHPQAPGRHEKLRDQLADSPTLEECLTRLRTSCVGVPLVAHNAATEKGVLSNSLPLESFGPWIDTLKLARSAWPDLSSYKLEDLIQTFDLEADLNKWLPGREPHDALYDAAASARFLQHLLSQPGWGDVDLDTLVHPDQSTWNRRK